jgi:hypothetical protein
MQERRENFAVGSSGRNLTLDTHDTECFKRSPFDLFLTH